MTFFDKTLEAYTTLSGRSKEDELESISKKCDMAVPYSLENRSVIGKVVRVIDGDSVVVSIPIGDTYYKIHIRIRDLDCPETRTRLLVEKELGFKAKAHVENLVGTNLVVLKLGDFDKFGRLLADIHTEDGTNVAESLIESNLGRFYDGSGPRGDWP